MGWVGKEKRDDEEEEEEEEWERLFLASRLFGGSLKELRWNKGHFYEEHCLVLLMLSVFLLLVLASLSLLLSLSFLSGGREGGRGRVKELRWMEQRPLGVVDIACLLPFCSCLLLVLIELFNFFVIVVVIAVPPLFPTPFLPSCRQQKERERER